MLASAWPIGFCQVIGQFNLGFIVARLGGDLFILDQHACEEKTKFEELQRSTNLHEQTLIAPLVLEATAAEEEVCSRSHTDCPAFPPILCPVNIRLAEMFGAWVFLHSYMEYHFCGCC